MVTTRSSGRSRVPAVEDVDSSTGESDIPAHIRRRGPSASIGTPATLRPLKQTPESRPSAAKRKKDGDIEIAHSGKRQKSREPPAIKDSIEVGGETDETGDETLLAGALDILQQPPSKPTSKPAIKIVVDIPTSRHMRESMNATSTTDAAPQDQSPARNIRPLRAKRIKRGVSSLEVSGNFDSSQPRTRHGNGRGTIRETPQPQSPQPVQHEVPASEAEEEAVTLGNESLDQHLGSPELQSSASKRRSERPEADVYDFPDDETVPPTPRVTQHATARNTPSLSDRARTAKRAKIAKKARSRLALSRKSLSSIPEEQPQPASSPRPPHASVSAVTDRRANDVDGLGEFGSSDSEDLEEQEDLEESEEEGEQEETEKSEESEQSEESSSESDQEADAAPHGAAKQNTVSIKVQPYAQSRTITVISNHLNNMLGIMGKRGWTGAGEVWGAHLLTGEAPTHTKLGRRCYKSLDNLKTELDQIPDASNLPRQTRFLTAVEQPLNEAMTSVDEVVTKIIKDALADPSDFNPRNTTNRRQRLKEKVVKDLLTCLVPMLVLVLRSCFAMGVTECNIDSGDPLPEKGIFTGATVQYMLIVTSWMLSLEKPLTQVLLNQPVNEDGDFDAGQAEDPGQPWKQNREKAGVMLRKWKEQLKLAVDGYHEQADRDKKKQQDRAIKKKRRKEKEEQLALDAKRHMAFVSNVQQVNSQPRPNVELWRKANQGRSLPPSSSNGDHNGRNNATGAQHSRLGPRTKPQSSLLSSTSSSRQAPIPVRQPPTRSTPAAAGGFAPRQQPRSALPPLVPDYEPWPLDDTEWLLLQLRQPNRRPGDLDDCAYVLSRPLNEVRKEKERLKRTGRYRSPG